METRKLIGYKLIQDHFGRKQLFPTSDTYIIGRTIPLHVLKSWNIDIEELNRFPENWQPVYESVPVTEKDIDDIVYSIQDLIGAYNRVLGYDRFDNSYALGKIKSIITQKLLPIAFLLISLSGFSQTINEKINLEEFHKQFDSQYIIHIEKRLPEVKHDSLYYAHERLINISRGYHNFELQKDRSIMFGLIAGMMAPTIAGFFICKNNTDKFGMTFYGSYAAIDLAAVFMFVKSEIKAYRIKKHYLKLTNG